MILKCHTVTELGPTAKELRNKDMAHHSSRTPLIEPYLAATTLISDLHVKVFFNSA